MKIPKTLKIGGLVFEVKIEHGVVAGREDVALGLCDTNLCVIKIDKVLGQSLKESVLLHEILEAINAMHELQLPHNAITTLETALYQILKDNRLLKEWYMVILSLGMILGFTIGVLLCGTTWG